MKKLDNYWFVAVILEYKANNNWGLDVLTTVTPKLSRKLFTPVCGQMDVRLAVCWQALALKRQLRPELLMDKLEWSWQFGFLFQICLTEKYRKDNQNYRLGVTVFYIKI